MLNPSEGCLSVLVVSRLLPRPLAAPVGMPSRPRLYGRRTFRFCARHNVIGRALRIPVAGGSHPGCVLDTSTSRPCVQSSPKENFIRRVRLIRLDVLDVLDEIGYYGPQCAHAMQGGCATRPDPPTPPNLSRLGFFAIPSSPRGIDAPRRSAPSPVRTAYVWALRTSQRDLVYAPDFRRRRNVSRDTHERFIFRPYLVSSRRELSRASRTYKARDLRDIGRFGLTTCPCYARRLRYALRPATPPNLPSLDSSAIIATVYCAASDAVAPSPARAVCIQVSRTTRRN